MIKVTGALTYDPDYSAMDANVDLWIRGYAAYAALPWRTRFLMFLRGDPADEDGWINPGPPPLRTWTYEVREEEAG